MKTLLVDIYGKNCQALPVVWQAVTKSAFVKVDAF